MVRNEVVSRVNREEDVELKKLSSLVELAPNSSASWFVLCSPTKLASRVRAAETVTCQSVAWSSLQPTGAVQCAASLPRELRFAPWNQGHFQGKARARYTTRALLSSSVFLHIK